MISLIDKVLRRARRLINNTHRYDFPPAAPGIVKKPGPVIGSNDTGSLFDPFCLCDDDNNLAIFVSCRKNGTVCYCNCKNHEDYSELKEALHGDPGFWDTAVNRASVLKHDNRWYMWYTGQHSGVSSIGLAISSDGHSFQKIQKESVLSAELSFEGVSVMNPCVLYDCARGIFTMWYSAGEDYEPDVICYAESTDGIFWKKRLEGPVLRPNKNLLYEKDKLGGCHVVKLSEDLLGMFYIGYQNIDVARICFAISDDRGISWKRSRRNPLICPSKGSWDCDSVYKPTVLLENASDTATVWYNGRKDRDEYIGVARLGSISELVSTCVD